MTRLAPAIAEFPADDQRALYLGIAKAAIVSGHTDAARFAAAQAATVATQSVRDAARAQLYLDAAAIVSDDVVKGVAALEAADGARLSPEDADLRDAALAVARSVQAPVPDPGSDAGAAAHGPDAVDVTLLDHARDVISSGDTLLEKAQ